MILSNRVARLRKPRRPFRAVHRPRERILGVEPLWTDPGWNLHAPAEICIDAFQANRAPDRRYRTSPIGAIFTHAKGGFYHDGRFATLGAVVDHYNTCMNLNLSPGDKSDLIQYLLSLTF